MEKNFEIEIDETTTDETQGAQLPLNFLSFGEIQRDDVKVYIKQDVYKDLEKYAASDTSKELGTILIGDYCENGDSLSVIISNHIVAKYTDASAATLTFTHETWEYVHKKHDSLYSDKKIIGWQHTHPNYGIFLSNYDTFIQENFFNMPFQVAYVIDPVQNIRGFFQWKDGKIEKLKGYYIYDEVGKPIKIEQKKVSKEEKSEKVVKSSKLQTVLISVLCVLTVALSAFSITMLNKYNEQLRLQKILAEKVETQEQTIYSQSVNSGTFTPESTNENEVEFVSYIVQEGDTLYDICQEQGVDFEASKNIILSMNGITNSDSIYAGQEIILPVS